MGIRLGGVEAGAKSLISDASCQAHSSPAGFRPALKHQGRAHVMGPGQKKAFMFVDPGLYGGPPAPSFPALVAGARDGAQTR